ncbi:zinc finger BED domain-containing protein RICESLEEPER 2-like [Vicia villosa]|uniref:zinc finger BED domain-containing protein RICESLEEPER 2-like n=1 Tax=Vicia villosa TaxID=3911 RepID=UPI00273C298B|nr:zinc finger BED domain-containing protein RICESLEEPER 2-like [Vicia villosa]
MCNGEFFHIRCSAHVLNLIVQEGLKIASEALHKIRESVKYIKGSDGRMLKFKDCVEDAGINVGGGLRYDVSTRWNSTYLMLESALQYRKAFEFYKVADRSYKYCPSEEEWERGERICEFLEPFYDITNLISGSSYPTANLYFMQVWKVQCILEKHQKSIDKVIKDMSDKMKVKFDKYWKNYSVVLAFGAILDPRLKEKFLKFCYSTLDASTSKEKLEKVMDKFKGLYEEYVSCSTNQIVSLSQSSYEFNSLAKLPRDGNKAKKSKIISVSFLLTPLVQMHFLHNN